MEMTDGLPRRARIDLYSDAEKAIHDAAQVVEKAGANVLLTEALVLLHRAQEKVADYVELDVGNEALKKKITTTKCERCDECGGAETYANQVVMPLDGDTKCIDWCIHQIVASLNAGGVKTVACCCGHGEQDGRIDLDDGRVLTINRES